ncbi:MAG: EAL domain-containing protein, partial [Candidatus Eremiobacteraeota bacterium]|nr:EAL domain-containing protein [Candidatus Eremiobacteraeota bacterium]
MLGERDLRQLDDLLSRSPLAVVVWDEQFRVSYWSSRAEEVFGYRTQDVLGKLIDEFPLVFPEDLAEVQALQRQMETISNVRAGTRVNRNIRADGAVRVCRWTTFAWQDDPKYHILCYADDITDSTVAQAALADSEGRFRSLFEHNPDVIMVFSPNGEVVDVNEAITRYGSGPREHIIGQHFSAFLAPDDVPKHEMYLKRALSGETLFYHAGVRAPDGSDREASITTVPIHREGSIEGAFSIIRDETDQRIAQARIERQERQLAESEARFRSLFDHNPDGVLAVSPDQTITEVNDACLRLGDFPRHAVIGESFMRFLPPHEYERVEAAFARALAGESLSLTMESFRIDGTPLELNATLIPQYSGGHVDGVYTVIQDITKRRAAERHADMQSQRIRNLYYIATGGDYPDVRMHASLEMGCMAFGLTCGAVVEISDGVPRIDSVYNDPATDPISDEDIMAAALNVTDESERGGIPKPFKNGVAMRLDVGGEPYGALVFATAQQAAWDFSSTDADLLGLIDTLIAGTIDRSRQRTRLRAMAYYDALTGLPNRAFLSEKLRDAIEVAQSRLGRVALLFLDLDRFKDVNDTLGHDRGDWLLQMVARRLVTEIGELGTIGRMGGDEFVVLLADCRSQDQARDIAERIIAAVSEPFTLDEYEQFISTSIGISIYPEDGRDDQTLIKNADIAMYRAKERGRNGYFFYNPSLEAPINMRLSQEKLLRRALELDEFVVYYQPQIDVRSGEVVSVEALVRWNHPKSGLIEPSHFIPSAEISGLIVPLGDWVLATAAKQVRTWHGELGPLRLAVNLSGRQFHQRDLRERVLQALEAASLDPAFLEVEITESVAMSDAAQTVGIVSDLKRAGIRTAVDDFGTGYSSLAYLRRFALDVLKIDGSFVRGIGQEIYDETIVKTVIGMAHSLGLEVVAEGVETKEQLTFLTQHS